MGTLDSKTVYNGLIWVRQETYDQAIFQSVYVENEYQINNFEDKIVVDVGAHIGAFSLLASHKGAKKVYAYEPNEDSFRILKRNVNGTCVNAYNMGVHDEDDYGLKMVYSSDEQNTGGCQTVVCAKSKVRSITLDTIINKVGEIDLLKLDCEGAEYLAILNSKRLKRVKAIFGEYHGPDFYPFDDFKKTLNDEGFFCGYKSVNDNLGHFHAIRL
jgi:FkbM family methyltransferase